MSFEVIPAHPSHADDLLITLQEAREFKIAHGDMGWREPFTLEHIHSIIAKGNTYVALLNGQHVGSPKLTWEDPAIWGERGTDGLAVYVHRLAVRQDYHHQGIGRLMLNWAGAQARLAGRTLIRLDCNSEQDTLRERYESQGFTFVGLSPLPDYPGALYERAA